MYRIYPSKGALWFIWPAVDDEWKISIGLKADPEAAAKAAEAVRSAQPSKAAVEEKAMATLPAAALKEIEDAPKAHAHVETDEDKLFAKAAASGDFTYLEEKWETFAEKSSRPGEEDDEEEEEEDDGKRIPGWMCLSWMVHFTNLKPIFLD